ncbi:MAG TPA: Rieske 2Fe-2S domain-containing protein [Streptosporangiaceae bacterium]|jgi:ubiquinol-cytochrome c reductase iron-sulfur subunit|nr:Rieske 2Fe-2S domain-containing protein [Streptosporangiaceae bacterium]
MSDDDHNPIAEPEEGDGAARPHRVIGTPSPASAHNLLGESEHGGASGRTLLDPAASEGGQAVQPGYQVLPGDPAAEKRAEKFVGFFFLLSGLASVGFIAAYIGLPVGTLGRTFHSNVALGLAMTVGFLSMGAGMVIWVRKLMPDVELTEVRKPVASTAEARQEFQQTFMEGAEASGFAKRPILRRSLIAASVPLALSPIVLLRDMGPLPGTTLRHTVWRKGMRLLVFGSNTPIKPEDFDTAGGLITVIPDGYQDNDDELAKAASILIKLEPGELQPPTVMKWTVQNIVCYSKICTHVGCPVALYEQTTHHILCPCHQSTFNAPTGATVIFGPAPRPLPQLPLMVDSEGYLAAAGDFDEPVGPSFWERG